MSSELLLEKEQEINNESLDREYQENCCQICGNHLQYVRMYPAMCGMCKKRKENDDLDFFTTNWGNRALGGGLTPSRKQENSEDFNALNSNNGPL